MYETENKIEKALAVTVIRKGKDRELALEHLDELVFLAQTAGADVVETIYQEMVKPHVATFLGKGKLEEVRQQVEDEKIDLVIFDDDLSPMQVRNIENVLKIKIIDRSGLILDIFAKRAKTQEAITQVELAQMQYLMPRLTRMWTHLSKQYGGIGTKGPGETQIETDRRIIKTRIQLLKKKLHEIEKRSELQRKSRQTMPRFGLVGYTNAGKSTVMRLISGDETVYVEDKLFATLDTIVRTFDLPSGEKALLSDTVGFIRKLPTHLIASFRSTLAEARESDILLHIIDVSHPKFEEQIEVVESTFKELKIDNSRVLMVFNKIDLLTDTDELLYLGREYPDAVFISATKGINRTKLLERMQQEYDTTSTKFHLFIPYDKMHLLSILFSNAEIIDRNDADEGTEYFVKVQDDRINFFKNTFDKYLTHV